MGVSSKDVGEMQKEKLRKEKQWVLGDRIQARWPRCYPRGGESEQGGQGIPLESGGNAT